MIAHASELPVERRTDCDEVPDCELLRQFVGGDHDAFSLLVQRHAGLVMSVCRRVLPRAHDAEDAFQASFLVLARKAKELTRHDSLAGWLHQTALRTSLKLRAMALRRINHEHQAGVQRSAPATAGDDDPAHQAALRELAEILDAELAALPLRFREVILLSQVEGLTRDEVAARLKLTSAAVKDRLERGREKLRARLIRRGVTLSAATLAVWFVPTGAQAAELATITASTSQAVAAIAHGSLAVGISPTAVTLAQGVLNMMGVQKLKFCAAWLVSFLAAGGIAFGMLRDEPRRFEKGLVGQVVEIDKTSKVAKVTISLAESGTLLSLDVAAQAKVWTAFEASQLEHVKTGQFVS
jgi:RNA polymerase sigma factor (sigma-70 family)